MVRGFVAAPQDLEEVWTEKLCQYLWDPESCWMESGGHACHILKGSMSVCEPTECLTTLVNFYLHNLERMKGSWLSVSGGNLHDSCLCTKVSVFWFRLCVSGRHIQLPTGFACTAESSSCIPQPGQRPRFLGPSTIFSTII